MVVQFLGCHSCTRARASSPFTRAGSLSPFVHSGVGPLSICCPSCSFYVCWSSLLVACAGCVVVPHCCRVVVVLCCCCRVVVILLCCCCRVVVVMCRCPVYQQGKLQGEGSHYLLGCPRINNNEQQTQKSPLDFVVRPTMPGQAPENQRKNTVVKKQKNMYSAYPQSTRSPLRKAVGV